MGKVERWNESLFVFILVIKLGLRVTSHSVFNIYDSILILRVEGDDEGWIST
jgi:hypothetical protein